ncbi:hypothetical protein VTH82DRAFT_3937 [Thermothelomyces myriococcoides]
MVNLILHYLLGLPDIVGPVNTDTGDVSAARKRKSLDLATMMASKNEPAADPLLFNLVDLILSCLRSQNNQTVYVTLQLVSVILKRHHRYAVITLLYTEGVLGESHHRTLGAHQQEVEYLISLAGSIGGQDNFDEIYDSILKDTQGRLENHPCSIRLITPKTSTHNHKLPDVPDTLPGAPRDVRSHTLHPSDPLLNIVLDHLETFFINPVDTNLALTEAIFDLAACGFMHLEGWFMRSPSSYIYEEDDDGPPLPDPPLDHDSQEYIEYKQMQAMQESRRRPRWVPSSLPRLLKILQKLCDQVAAYRETIPRFDDLLQQRREAFQIADCANQPLPLHPPRVITPLSHSSAATPGAERAGASPDESRNASRERPSGLEGIAQRILSEFSTPALTGSPRGRKEGRRPPSDRSVPVSPPPPAFPQRLSSSSVQISRPVSPGIPSASNNSLTVSGQWDSGRPDAVASQARAFQAVDQSILARKVGMPELRPISLDFDRQRAAGGVSSADEKQAADEEEAKAEEGGGEDALLAPSEDGERSDDDGDDGGGGVDGGKGDVGTGEPGTPTIDRTVSVSHVLTNTIVLQAFLFELASVVQAAAAAADEDDHVDAYDNCNDNNGDNHDGSGGDGDGDGDAVVGMWDERSSRDASPVTDDMSGERDWLGPVFEAREILRQLFKLW